MLGVGWHKLSIYILHSITLDLDSLEEEKNRADRR